MGLEILAGMIDGASGIGGRGGFWAATVGVIELSAEK